MNSDRYEIEKTINEGDHSKVHRAFDKKLKRTVAIKEFNSEKITREFKIRFQREIEILSMLDHPNIIPIYDFHVSDTEIYYVMKYIEGPDLKKFIVNIPDEAKIQIFLTLLKAVQYIHKKKIIHRDLKPSNILFDSYGTLYVIDFGISKIDDDLLTKITKSKAYIGTVYYSSPEQIKGEPLKTTTDIYSLGIIFYEMLTGKIPFDGPVQSVFHSHLYIPPPPLDAANKFKNFEAVCFRMLEKNTAIRIDDCSIVIKDIEWIIFDEKSEKKKENKSIKKKAALILSAALIPLCGYFIFLKSDIIKKSIYAVKETVYYKISKEKSPDSGKPDELPSKPDIPIPEDKMVNAKNASDFPSTETKIESPKEQEIIKKTEKKETAKFRELKASSNVKIRKEPNTGSDILAIIPVSTKIKVRETEKTGKGKDQKTHSWFKDTEFDGFIFGEYLSADTPKTARLRKISDTRYQLVNSKKSNTGEESDIILNNHSFWDGKKTGKYKIGKGKLILKYSKGKSQKLCYDSHETDSDDVYYEICQ